MKRIRLAALLVVGAVALTLALRPASHKPSAPAALPAAATHTTPAHALHPSSKPRLQPAPRSSLATPPQRVPAPRGVQHRVVPSRRFPTPIPVPLPPTPSPYGYVCPVATRGPCVRNPCVEFVDPAPEPAPYAPALGAQTAHNCVAPVTRIPVVSKP